jgi:hypothetical protein
MDSRITMLLADPQELANADDLTFFRKSVELIQRIFNCKVNVTEKEFFSVGFAREKT